MCRLADGVRRASQQHSVRNAQANHQHSLLQDRASRSGVPISRGGGGGGGGEGGGGGGGGGETGLDGWLETETMDGDAFTAGYYIYTHTAPYDMHMALCVCIYTIYVLQYTHTAPYNMYCSVHSTMCMCIVSMCVYILCIGCGS